MSDYRGLFVCERHVVSDDCQRVIVVGEIDLATGPRLAGVLIEAQAHARHVVLDLEETTFIDAGGGRILLAAEVRAHATAGTFAIAHAPAHVDRLLRLVGIDRALLVPAEVSRPHGAPVAEATATGARSR